MKEEIERRPDFTEITSGIEFQRWYWLKEELIDLCKMSGLPSDGSKFLLRDRIIYALDHEGAVMPEPKKKKPESRFDWAREVLGSNTIITDNVSFGPNFRNYMKSQIGAKFSCHSDFMDWVKENPGKTLDDAVTHWHVLEKRKEDPTFKRKIARHNMLAQYVRDFSRENPTRNLRDALACWKVKRNMPTDSGFVTYDSKDLAILEH